MNAAPLNLMPLDSGAVPGAAATGRGPDPLAGTASRTGRDPAAGTLARTGPDPTSGSLTRP